MLRPLEQNSRRKSMTIDRKEHEQLKTKLTATKQRKHHLLLPQSLPNSGPRAHDEDLCRCDFSHRADLHWIGQLVAHEAVANPR